MDGPEKQIDQTLLVESETLPEVRLDQPSKKLHMSKRFGFIKKGPLTKKEKVRFLVAVFLILAVGTVLITWINQIQVADPAWTSGIKKKVAPTKYYSKLSGLEVADEATTKRPVTAVMIENSPSARPQSGLAEAEVVFEAVAEGGITRFITLYQTNRPALIGPVRSLRPYYADWAAAFDPSVGHVGGSPEALDMIRSGNYGVDIDQFFNSGSYWRSTDRQAPHNVYTDSDKLDALNASKNKTTSNFTFSPRIDEKKSATPNASTIEIAVSTGIFSVGYDYEATSNSYIRKQGDEAHVDREKGQIKPKVVIAMKTDISLAGDMSHMIIATSSSGPVYVFQNGTVTEGTWSKADAKSQLYFKTVDGKEISLVRGQTWITTIGNDRSVSWQ